MCHFIYFILLFRGFRCFCTKLKVKSVFSSECVCNLFWEKNLYQKSLKNSLIFSFHKIQKLSQYSLCFYFESLSRNIYLHKIKKLSHLSILFVSSFQKVFFPKTKLLGDPVQSAYFMFCIFGQSGRRHYDRNVKILIKNYGQFFCD